MKAFTALPEFILEHSLILSLVFSILSYGRFLVKKFYLFIPVNRHHITILSDICQLSIQFCYALVVSIQSLGIHTLAMQFIALGFQEFLLASIHLVLLLFYLGTNILGKDFIFLSLHLNLPVVFRLMRFQFALQIRFQLVLQFFLFHLIGNQCILLIFQFSQLLAAPFFQTFFQLQRLRFELLFRLRQQLHFSLFSMKRFIQLSYLKQIFSLQGFMILLMLVQQIIQLLDDVSTKLFLFSELLLQFLGSSEFSLYGSQIDIYAIERSR